MAKIHYVDHTGETRTVEVENGATVMEGAIRNGIPGIEAECGGACACATAAEQTRTAARTGVRNDMAVLFYGRAS
jgi:ferredoxin